MRWLRSILVKRQVARLAEILRSENPDDRWAAADTLNALGPASAPAVHALAEALVDPDPTVRSLSAKALGKIGKAAIPAAPGLIRCLLDDDGMVFSAARFALEDIGQEALTSESLAAIDALGPLEKKTVIEALGPLASGASVDLPDVIAALCERDPQAVSSIAAQELIEVVQNYSGRARQMAVEALGAMGERAETAVPALIDLLKTVDDRDCILNPLVGATMCTLGQIGPKAAPAVPVLMEYIDDCPSMALWTIGSIGPAASAAAPRLLELLEGGESGKAIHSASALWRIEVRDPRIAATLEAAYESAIGLDAREFVMCAIARTELVPLLIRGLGDDCGDVVVIAADALGNLGKAARPSVPHLAEIATGNSFTPRTAAAIALLKIEPESSVAISALEDMLSGPVSFYETFNDEGKFTWVRRHSTESDRARLARELGKIGCLATALIPALRTAAAEHDPALRDAATTAIEQIESARL